MYAQHRLLPKQEIISHTTQYFLGIIEESYQDIKKLDAIRLHILALAENCFSHSMWQEVDSIAFFFSAYLDLRGYWTERVIVIQRAITASQHMNDRLKECIWLDELSSAYYFLDNYPVACEYAFEGLAIAHEIENIELEGRILGILGLAHTKLHYFEQAFDYQKKALEIAKKFEDVSAISSHTGNIGLIYTMKGEYETAIDYYIQAIDITQGTDFEDRDGNHHGNLGDLNYRLGRYEDAIDYYNIALTKARQDGDRRREENWLSGLGRSCHMLGRYELAIDYHNQALLISEEIIGRPTDKGGPEHDLGDIYRAMGQFGQAITFYKRSLEAARAVAQKENECITLFCLGDTYKLSTQLELALECYQQSLNLAQELDNQYYRDIVFDKLNHLFQEQGAEDQCYSPGSSDGNILS